MNTQFNQTKKLNHEEEGSPLRAGVVGLGMIGGGVAVSLVRRNRIPAVYDIRPDAADSLGDVPHPLSSPAEVAKASEVVMVAVVNATQALDVICGQDGLLEGAHCNLIIVLLSTVALSVVHKLAEFCKKANVGFLDCGVTPGNKAAENGMVAIVGGEEDVVERALPVLEDWAKKVVHCGPVGAGMATKIARNVVTFGSWYTVTEAGMLAEAAGVKPEKLIEVIETADPEGTTLLQLFRKRDANGNLPKKVVQVIEPLMMKDLEAAQNLATTLGIDVPLVDVALTHADQTLGIEKESNPLPEDPQERGKEMMSCVYGQGFSTSSSTNLPFINETVNHLFANIWSRPVLSIRDRRLLTIGVTAALGRAELLQVQITGALANKELTQEQLQEAVVHLAYYVGWGNATAVQQGVNAAIQAFNAKENGESS
ncbi:MAG: NAD-binding protein [Flavisolibacter sp.]|nr:NAD-binding protein [Flavisolibacter sp.]